VANAWATLIFPRDLHEITVTLLGRYHSETHDAWGIATDLALRYSLPIARTRLTVAADVVNVFEGEDWPYYQGRSVRGWLRLRL
jgi:hypothetical protein